MMAPHNRSNSSLNAPPMQQFVEPEPLRYFRLCLSAIILIGSLVGNTVVIRAVVRANGVKSIAYFLICNLALAEIISSCCLPFMLSYEELHSWPFSESMCHLINPLQITAGMVVTTCIASIATVRCLFVMRMRLYQMTRSTTIAVLLGFIIWVAAFMFVLPYFLYMTKVPSMANDGRFWCLLILPGDKLDESYPSPSQSRLIITYLIVNYVLPLTITLLCYSLVISKLRFHKRVSVAQVNFRDNEGTPTQTEEIQMDAHASGCDTNERPEMCSTSPPSAAISEEPIEVPARVDELNEYESDLLKMFYAIVLIFVFCYLPYQCFFMLEYLGNLSWHNWEYFDVTRRYLFLLTCCPSALHPICYGLMSRFYHKAFSKLVLCRAV